MDNDFEVPAFEKRHKYNFGVSEESFEIYQELNAIAEEIEQCRLRNC